VLDLVALVECAPFPPGRPPWDVTLFQGVEGGPAVLFLRAHHVLTDGLGGARLAGLLLDGATPRATSDAPSVDGVGGRPPTRRPGTFTVTLDVRDVVRPIAAGVNGALNTDLVDAAARRFERALDVAHSLSRQVVLGLPSPPAPAGSVESRFEAITVPGARSAALALGGSRSDLVVAAALAGVARYHEHLGLDCPALRLGTSVSRSRRDALGGNSFTPLRVDLPSAGTLPGRHFGVVASRLAEARADPALALAGPVASALNRLPNRVLLPLLRSQLGSIDLLVNVVPGLRRPHTLAGAPVEASYPFGPRVGAPVNITAFCNEDRLDIGVSLDPGAIVEPAKLMDCLGRAMDALVELGSRRDPASGAPLPDGHGSLADATP
jgi:hypothetical protein